MRYTLYNNRMRNSLAGIFCMLLSCTAAQVAAQQSQQQNEQAAIIFDAVSHDFGDVAEDGGSVEHTFTFTNRTSKPVVILDVTTGCGCTTPTYSRKPVMGGQTGSITVAFDPINRPGHFSKDIVVLTSASKEPITLQVEGVVIPRVKSTEELYPFDMGAGVRFDSNFRAFAYVGRGGKVEESIGWINTSDSDRSMSLDKIEDSGMLRIEAPSTLKAGEKGIIRLIYEVPESSDRYGTLSDVLGVGIDGRRARTLVSVHAIAVDRYDNAADDISSPKGILSKNFLKFGDVKHGEKAADSSLKITNTGEGELIIRAVEWQNKALGCSLKTGDRIPADGSATIELTLDTADADYGVWVDRLRIITNDPARPMQTLRVTAIVTE